MSAPNTADAAWRVAAALQRVTAQWRENMRLRVGLWLVLGIVWVYALLAAGDWTRELDSRTADIQRQSQRLRPLRQGAIWTERDRDATDALQRLRALAWQGAERGLIEANVQDWLRSLASKSGVGLRELRLLSDPSTDSAPAASAPVPSSAATALLRLRMVVEFKRVQAMGLLAELARHEPLVSVERMTIHAGAQPAVMELELRAAASIGGPAQ